MVIGRPRPFIKTWIITIVVVGLVVMLIVILKTMTGKPSSQQDNLAQVHERVVHKLETNDLTGLYMEMAPSFREGFSLDSFAEGAMVSQQANISTIEVRVISEPVIKTDNPWNSEWADSEIQMVFQDKTTNYLVRFHLEEGQWWLYGTIELE